MDRRRFLTTCTLPAVAAVAGCSSQQSDREPGGPNGDDATDDPTPTPTQSGGGDQLVELLDHQWYNDGPYDAGVTGQVENVSGQELSYVGVEVFFLDENDVQFQDSLDNTTDLAAGRVWEFDAPFLSDETERVDAYEIRTDVSDY